MTIGGPDGLEVPVFVPGCRQKRGKNPDMHIPGAESEVIILRKNLQYMLRCIIIYNKR